jgi:hypothetical protein
MSFKGVFVGIWRYLVLVLKIVAKVAIISILLPIVFVAALLGLALGITMGAGEFLIALGRSLK